MIPVPAIGAVAKPSSGGGGGGDYTGPLDIVPGAVVAYGQRALSAATRGSALYTIREDAGDTTQAFSSDATTGAAPVAAITAFLNGANGVGSLWSDQGVSGSDLIFEPLLADVPWVAAGLGGKPSFDTPSISFSIFNDTTTLPGGEYTLFIVSTFDRDLDPRLFRMQGASFFIIYTDYNVPGDIAIRAGAGHSLFYSDESVSAGNNSHIVEVVVDSAGTPTVWVDGSQFTMHMDAGDLGPIEGIVPGGIIEIFSVDQSASELIAWNAALSSGDRLAIRQNIAAYYGITLA